MRSVRFTADHYRALPTETPRTELLDGEYVETPSPSERHQTIVGLIHFLLMSHVRAHPVGRVFVAPFDVYLSEHDVPQPDVLLVLNTHSDRIHPDGVHGAPDLVVEVLSPGTASSDLTLKKEIYRRGGVPEYWLVDPKSGTIALYRLQEKADRILFSTGEILKTSLLPGFEAKLSEIFA